MNRYSLHLMVSLFITGFIAFISPATVAYIGPGAGLSAIGSLLALVVALIVAIFGFLWYPIKRLMKKNKTDESLQDTTKET